MNTKIGVGSIIVHKGNPPNNNPFKGKSVMGDDRKSALTSFKNNQPTTPYTFWSIDPLRIVEEITNPDLINWGTAGIL